MVHAKSLKEKKTNKHYMCNGRESRVINDAFSKCQECDSTVLSILLFIWFHFNLFPISNYKM